MKNKLLLGMLFIIMCTGTAKASSTEYVTMDVGETKTLYLPASVTTKRLRTVYFVAVSPNYVDIKYHSDFSVTVEAKKATTSPVIIRCDYTYYELRDGVYVYGGSGFYDWSITVNAIKPISIDVYPRSVYLSPGDRRDMSVSIYPENAESNYTWSSTDYSVAYVDDWNELHALKKGYAVVTATTSNGKSSSCEVTVEAKEKIELTANPSGGKIKAGSKVTLSASVYNAYIYYTLNGSTPTTSSYRYTSPIEINSSLTLKARAYKDGYETSDILTVNYTIEEPQKEKIKLTANPSGGEVAANTKVTLQSSVSNANIYYTTNGSTPTTSSTRYTSPITINSTLTLKARAYKDGYETSDVLTETYTIKTQQEEGYYLVGDINGWDSWDKSYSFTRLNDGLTWEIDLPNNISQFHIFANGGEYWDGTYVYGVDSYSSDRKSGTMANMWEGLAWDFPEGTNGKLQIVPSKKTWKLIDKTTTTTTHSVTTSRAGYATFYDSSTAYTLPNGLSASVVTSATNDKLTYKKIADGTTSNNTIPKGVAVMLTSSQKQAATYTLTSTENAASYTGTNLLHGSDVSTTTSGSNSYYYKLAYGPSGTSLSSVFGWYWGSNNGGAFQIDGHKAWLAVPKSASAKGYAYFTDDEATAIQELEVEGTESNVYYDLQGRRIVNPTAKGIYIHNGKKITIK